MAHTYAGANVFPANVTIPDDGDPRNASSVNTAFEALADRTVNLNTRLGAIPNRIVYAHQLSTGATPLIISGIPDTPGSIFASIAGGFALLTGDVIVADATFYARVSLGPSTASFSLNVEGATGNPVIGESELISDGSFLYSIAIAARYVATSPGSVSIGLRTYNVPTPGVGKTFEIKFLGAGIRWSVIRP